MIGSKNTPRHNDQRAGRQKLVASTREYRTIMSEIARLFQRAALIGNEDQRAEMMGILKETKQKLAELLERIDEVNKNRRS